MIPNTPIYPTSTIVKRTSKGLSQSICPALKWGRACNVQQQHKWYYLLPTAELQHGSRRVKSFVSSLQYKIIGIRQRSDIQRKVNRLASHQPPLSAQRTPCQAWRPTPTSIFWVRHSGGEYRRSALGEYSLWRMLEWKLRMTENIIKKNAWVVFEKRKHLIHTH